MLEAFFQVSSELAAWLGSPCPLSPTRACVCIYTCTIYLTFYVNTAVFLYYTCQSFPSLVACTVIHVHVHVHTHNDNYNTLCTCTCTHMSQAIAQVRGIPFTCYMYMYMYIHIHTHVHVHTCTISVFFT